MFQQGAVEWGMLRRYNMSTFWIPPFGYLDIGRRLLTIAKASSGFELVQYIFEDGIRQVDRICVRA